LLKMSHQSLRSLSPRQTSHLNGTVLQPGSISVFSNYVNVIKMPSNLYVYSFAFSRQPPH
jgi:hypothetical protein